MAEFHEVAKIYDRLCESYDECYKCPMFRNRDRNDSIACRYWILIVNPKTAEEVILHWGKEHPIKTNGMKFREVFGFALDEKCAIPISILDWLDEEYKEGDESD